MVQKKSNNIKKTSGLALLGIGIKTIIPRTPEEIESNKNELIKEKELRRRLCKCGSYIIYDESRHIKTKKHLNFIQTKI